MQIYLWNVGQAKLNLVIPYKRRKQKFEKIIFSKRPLTKIIGLML